MALIRTGPFWVTVNTLPGRQDSGAKILVINNRFRMRSTEGGAVPQVERAHD